MTLVVGLDGDDTLWHNERVFSMTHDRFRSLVAPYVDADTLDRALVATERRNLALLGYGVKSFILAMIETAIEVTGGRVPAAVIGELLEAGRQMLDHPVELLDGAADAVAALAARWDLILITKGDLFHQESKVARSGLLPHFARVEIVSEKDPAAYRRILAAAGVAPEQFVMVGDSMRSDIQATLAIGARAVHVPGFREWELEQAEVDQADDGRWWRLDSIGAVVPLLATLE